MLNYLSEIVALIDDQYTNSTIIVVGDFNRLKLDELEVASGLLTLDSPPTRHTAKLDLFLSNRPDLVDLVSTFKSNIETDHLGLIARPIHRYPPKRHTQTFRLITHRGHRRLNSLISTLNFSHVYNSENVHDAAERLENQIMQCFEQAFPLKKVRMSDSDPCWMTPRIKWTLGQKKQALRRGQTKKAISYDNYIKAAKIHNMMQLGSRSWWQTVDSVTHRKVTSNRLDANAFRASQLNEELASRSALQDGEIRESHPIFEISDQEVPKLTTLEVARVMRSCRRTSAGPSGIPSFIFREYWDILTAPYLHLWNLSLEQGIVPAIYKSADLIPIPKVRNAKCASEVRGISVTPIAARLFERAVHQRWITPRIISIGDPYQFAYKPRVSTTDCLLCFQFYILSMLDRLNIDGVHAAIIDFSKAFDRVNQEKAANIYPRFIQSPYIRRWLYDFTTDRRQRLIWNGTPLDYQSVDRGCSQGTVGGPGIFGMYTDSLRSFDTNSRIFKYSDDTNCLSPCIKDPSLHEKEIFSRETQMLFDWATENGLEINREKSKHVRFCLNRTPFCQCLRSEEHFDTVKSVRILGIIFQDDCSFGKHCRYLLSHLRSLIYLFKDLRLNGTTIDGMHQVFESLVVSRIRYGISVYGSDTASLKRIDKFLQKCFERQYCKIKFETKEILRQEDNRNLKNILMNPTHPLHDYLVSRRKLRTTRHNFTSTKPYVRTKTFLESFANRVLPY